jgi:hypothetical protein
MINLEVKSARPECSKHPSPANLEVALSTSKLRHPTRPTSSNSSRPPVSGHWRFSVSQLILRTACVLMAIATAVCCAGALYILRQDTIRLLGGPRHS